MPIEISWQIENHVIKTHFWGDLTEEEMMKNGEDLAPFMDSAQQPLYLLLDLREVTKFPLNFKNMLKGMSSMRSPNKVNWTVVLSENRLMNFFSLLASKTMDVPVHTYKNMDEAMQFIMRNAPQLAAKLPVAENE